MTTVERPELLPVPTAGRDRAAHVPASRSQMEARMVRHSIAPSRVAVLDLTDLDRATAVSGSDRAVAVGAILTGIAAAVGIAVGLV